MTTSTKTPRKLKTKAHLETKAIHVPKEPDTVQCNGKLSKRANEYCTQAPGWGTDHPGIGRCKWHGGAAPNYSQKVTHLRAAAAVETYGLPRDIDPHDALLEELARTAGHVDWLRIQVGNIEHPGATDEDEPTKANNQGSKLVAPVGGGQDGYPSYEANVWVRMYNDERKHLLQVSKTCIQAGIEERRIRLAESQGQIIANVLREVLSALNVLDLPETPQIVRKALESATGPAPAAMTAQTINGTAQEVPA